jgi:hypothetical protein
MALLAGSSFGQNLVVNGGFESPAVTNKTNVAYPDPATMFPWQTTATNFEIWTNGWTNGNGIGPLFSADGGQNLEILSTTNQATVWQNVPTIPGVDYVLSFFHTPRPGQRSILTVSANSNTVAIFDENGLGLTNFAWQQFTTDFTATSNLTTVSFNDLSLNFGGAGTHIDGVVLESNLVVNGSFASPAVTNSTKVAYPDLATMLPWQTTATNFEIWTNGWTNGRDIGPLLSAVGGQNLEILSTTNRATVWQTVPTVPGAGYVFGFYHTQRPGVDSTLTVSVNSNVVATFDETGSGQTNFAWQWFATNIVATSNLTTLSFSDVASGGAGTHIDGVVLEQNAGQPLQMTPLALVRPVMSAPPLLLSMEVLPGSQVQLYWPATPNQSYQLQGCGSLGGANWTNLGGPVSTKGTAIFTQDVPPAGTTCRFYRIVTSQ